MTPEAKEKTTAGFPSQFVDPEIKKTPEYCRSFAIAFDGDARTNPTDTGFSRQGTSSTKNRKLARGENDPNAYKEQLTLKSEDGRPNTSFRNLSWAILKIAPKLMNVLKAQVLNYDWNMTVRRIDPMAMGRKRLEKAKIQEFITNQEAILAFEEYAKKVQLERPINDEDIQDINPHSIDTYLDMNPKDMAAMETKDLLTMTLANANWDQKSADAVTDMVEIGDGAIHVFMDDANLIQLERWFPERIVTNKCLNNDYSDMLRVGYYDDISVSEIKRRTKGQWDENVYKTLANKNARNNTYTESPSSYWSESSYSYAYDHEKVRIFTCYWFSDDTSTHTEFFNSHGNRRVSKEKFNYIPFLGDKTVNEGKGMTDEQFNEQFKGQKTIYRTVVRNVYKCTWIVGTDYVFNYGLATNMARQIGSYSETMLPVAMYTTDRMSTVGNIETLLDQFQLNWLQFQSHVASSKPPGIAIEKNALARAAMGPGQAGKKVDWKKILQMYAESGNIVYDGYDLQGNPLGQHPFMELKNGLSEGAVKHLEIMLMMLDFMRNVLGINPLVEGQAPPERMGKQVMEMSFGATTNALSYLNWGYKSIYEKTCKLILGMLPDAFERGQLPSFQEAMGMETIRYMDLNKDIGLLDMGIYIEEGPDDAIRQRISDAINASIAKQELDPEDAIFIELEKNPYRAIQYLKLKRKQKMRLKQKADQQNIKVQADEQRKTEEMKLTAEENAQVQQWDREKQKLILTRTLDSQTAQESFLQQTILLKLQNKLNMTEEEQAFINKKALSLMEIREQGKIDKQIASTNAKNRATSK